MAEKLYRYGELYWVKFDEETVGTEVRGSRPGLIISDNYYNEISRRVIVLPCSKTLDPLYSFELFLPKVVKNIKVKKDFALEGVIKSQIIMTLLIETQNTILQKEIKDLENKNKLLSQKNSYSTNNAKSSDKFILYVGGG
ncbi:5247_t:CDS:2, partial [Funneliformis geosporum]